MAKNLPNPRDDPVAQIKRCITRDVAELKRKIMFWKEFDNPAICKETGTVKNWDDPNAPIFPNHCDILVIGGGAIGSSVAYFTKLLGRGTLRVVVVEKDPTVSKLKRYDLIL